MAEKLPKVNVDILVIKDNKILLGLLTREWMYEEEKVYGVPGRDLRFGEKIGEATRRIVKEEIGCEVKTYKIIAINANYALGNHYIGIGVIAEIKEEPQVLIPKDWEKWEWFHKDKIPENLFPSAKYLITCYLENKIIDSE